MDNWHQFNNIPTSPLPGKPDAKPDEEPSGNPSHPAESDPNWTRHHFPAVYAALLQALAPHPAAQSAVRQALRDLHATLHPEPGP